MTLTFSCPKCARMMFADVIKVGRWMVCTYCCHTMICPEPPDFGARLTTDQEE